MNKKIEKGRPELNPIPVKSPWYHLGIDFVGPISPPSSEGNRYILTVCNLVPELQRRQNYYYPIIAMTS